MFIVVLNDKPSISIISSVKSYAETPIFIKECIELEHYFFLMENKNRSQPQKKKTLRKMFGEIHCVGIKKDALGGVCSALDRRTPKANLRGDGMTDQPWVPGRMERGALRRGDSDQNEVRKGPRIGEKVVRWCSRLGSQAHHVNRGSHF